MSSLECIGFDDINHYQKMKSYTKSTLKYAIANECLPVLIGAALDLRDVTFCELIMCKGAIFVDINPETLDSIRQKLNHYNREFSYLKTDITGVISTIRKSIINIYLLGFSPSETIKRITTYFNRFDFNSNETICDKRVLLSMNVISELQPPIRAFVEKIHRFTFGESIEKTVDEMTLQMFKSANKVLYRKFIEHHLHMNEKYVLSQYFVSAYENKRSYLDPFMESPTDSKISNYIQETLNVPLKFDFWDWNITPMRIIRMCQFCVER